MKIGLSLFKFDKKRANIPYDKPNKPAKSLAPHVSDALIVDLISTAVGFFIPNGLITNESSGHG